MTAAAAAGAAYRSTRFPSWLLALAFGGASAGTYFYVLRQLHASDVNSQLEAEAARQEAAERGGGK